MTLISPGNYTEYERININHYSTGQKLDVKQFDGYDRLINGKPTDNFNDMVNLFKKTNDIYLNNYYTYERVINEVKPDLFFLKKKKSKISKIYVK